MHAPRWWQTRFPACLLLPVSALFGLLGSLRRGLYRLGILSGQRLPVPVVVVGNISAGGTGKTPTVQALAQALLAAGWQPGIISRGYGGQTRGSAAVPPDGSAHQYGDEPLLLARGSGCPVWVGRDRVATARALLAAHPGVDVLLSDDGLQHYRLGRNVEIAVIDGQRGLQNGWLLPAGPLREPASRLARVDALVINGASHLPLPAYGLPTFTMHLQPGAAHRLDAPTEHQPLAAFAGQRLAALAGIGNPARFFAMVDAAGLHATRHAFADHHQYTDADLAPIQADAILTTAKDAVKLAALHHGGNIWVVPVTPHFSPDLPHWLTGRLASFTEKHGRQTA